MEPNKKPSNLRMAKYYLINALKFYEMKNERITPVLFVIILFTGFASTLISEKTANDIYLSAMYNIASVFILYLASVVYLYSYMTELRGGECSLKQCLGQVFRKLSKILAAYIAFIAIILTGFFLLIIPGVIFYLMFMFNICYLLDKDIRVTDAFNASKNLTARRKMEIFAIFIVFNLTLLLPIFFIIILASVYGNNLILSFVVTFLSSILTLMQQRLIALLYFDLEYGTKRA
ncbi:MAG TPA: hypothetical protein PK733_04585 [Clostridiales bacterium]|nr:hypothetical protein [Clostridiales bacterium]